MAGDITPAAARRPTTSLADFVSRADAGGDLLAEYGPTDAAEPARGTHRHDGTTALSRPSSLSRLFGLGSVFGKTLRDSRRATLLIGLAIGALLVVVAAGIISQFDTPEARDEIGNIVNAVPPIMQGLAGKPVNVETLGGYIQYKYGGFLPLVTGLWSILALSATLAGESSAAAWTSWWPRR